jgi:hypothetical protein
LQFFIEFAEEKLNSTRIPDCHRGTGGSLVSFLGLPTGWYHWHSVATLGTFFLHVVLRSVYAGGDPSTKSQMIAIESFDPIASSRVKHDALFSSGRTCCRFAQVSSIEFKIFL